MGEQTAKAPGLNRAKTYQLVLFPLNNGATNVYYVLVLSYIATFGSKVLALSMIFASVMVTGMRLFDAITDPIIGALMDRTNGKFGKFRPFMVIGNLIMAASILVLYCLTPLIPASSMGLRYAAFVALYAVWVIGYTFQTSCTRSGQTVLTNDPKQRPLFTIFNQFSIDYASRPRLRPRLTLGGRTFPQESFVNRCRGFSPLFVTHTGILSCSRSTIPFGMTSPLLQRSPTTPQSPMLRYHA